MLWTEVTENLSCRILVSAILTCVKSNESVSCLTKVLYFRAQNKEHLAKILETRAVGPKISRRRYIRGSISNTFEYILYHAGLGSHTSHDVSASFVHLDFKFEYNFVIPALHILDSAFAMPPSSSILLRFESKDGQFRLTVNPTDQFPSLLSKVFAL